MLNFYQLASVGLIGGSILYYKPQIIKKVAERVIEGTTWLQHQFHDPEVERQKNIKQLEFYLDGVLINSIDSLRPGNRVHVKGEQYVTIVNFVNREQFESRVRQISRQNKIMQDDILWYAYNSDNVKDSGLLELRDRILIEQYLGPRGDLFGSKLNLGDIYDFERKSTFSSLFPDIDKIIVIGQLDDIVINKCS